MAARNHCRHSDLSGIAGVDRIHPDQAEDARGMGRHRKENPAGTEGQNGACFKRVQTERFY